MIRNEQTIAQIQQKNKQQLTQLFPMSTNLLTVFNSYAFHNSAQSLLSNLNITELKQLLSAIDNNKTYANLSHMIKATLFVMIGSSFDRTFYFMHYDVINCDNLRKQRIALIALQTQSHTLQKILKKQEFLQENGKQLFQDDFQAIWESFTNPDLALPPYVRENVAPHCQTVYQIQLALSNNHQYQENLCIQSQEKSEYIQQLLKFQIQATKIQLQSIKENESHFAELVIRYMLYRNTVLAIHSIIPFKRLSQPMQMWKQSLLSHILKANHVYITILDINQQGDIGEYGYFTPELFRNEGYMIEYSEMLVDLSVDEKNVIFCCHSKQLFDQPYTFLEEQLLLSINKTSTLISQNQDLLNKFQQNGLKPCTIRKVIDIFFNQNEQTDKCKQNYCCRNDNYIENCARINMNFDRSPTIIPCF